MVANLLGRLLAKAKDVGLIERFSTIEGSPTVPFIQFADDSLFMLKADFDGLRNLRCILLMVEAAIGPRVNWSNTNLSPVGNVPEVEDMANVLDREVLPLLISYLGFPLRAKSSSKSFWNPILEKMGSKLAHWKNNYLSLGGKPILLKSVLASMPIYFLSLYQAPTSMLCKMESLKRDFLWGSSQGKRKIH